MIIKALTIENFKSISGPVRVEFKPITLLFGPNSTGKSTIVQALHYAREIFERENVDPGKTLAGGSAIDLGGFQSMVHNHDLSRPICLRFDLDLAKDDLPEYLPRLEDGRFPGYTDDLVQTIALISGRVKSAWVRISIIWSELLGSPLVDSYEVGINGEILGRIVASRDGRQVSLVYLNLSNSAMQAEDETFTTDESFKQVNSGLQGLKSALPKWGEPLNMQGITYGGNSDVDFFMSYGLSSIQSMLIGPGELLRDALRNFCYLGPLREIPSRNYDLALSPDESRWASGIAAWDILSKADYELIRDVNIWLGREDRLHVGYQVERKQYKELDINHPLLQSSWTGDLLDDEETIRRELAQLPIKTRLFLLDSESGIEVLPQDIGVGISQLMPVVVLCLCMRNGLVAIEQPELHLHPALQVAIGDLFIEQAIKNESVFLLETHSEHLLLRLLRRIRETSENELPPGIAGLTPEQLSVNFVEQMEEGLRIRLLKVSQDGDFHDPWPNGFFTEREKELF